jgi:hypothetical protein
MWGEREYMLAWRDERLDQHQLALDKFDIRAVDCATDFLYGPRQRSSCRATPR